MSMMDYGFGYDEELPRGFQDADLEMREFEDRAAEQREWECTGTWDGMSVGTDADPGL